MNHLNILSLQESEYQKVVKGLVIGYARNPDEFGQRQFSTDPTRPSPTNLVVISTTMDASKAFISSQLGSIKLPDYGNIKAMGVRDISREKVFPVKGYVIFTPDLEFVNDHFFHWIVELFIAVQPESGSLFFDRVSLVVPDTLASRVYDALFTLWKNEQPRYLLLDKPKRPHLDDDGDGNTYTLRADKMLQTRTHELNRNLIVGRDVYLSEEIDALDAWFIKATLPILIELGAKFVYLPDSVQRKLFLHDILQSQFLTYDFMGQTCEELIEPNETIK